MNKRFSLIELIVSIVVLGILASIVIPNVTNIREESVQVSLDANKSNLQTAVDRYMLENNGEIPAYSNPYFGNPQILNLDLLKPKYTRVSPRADNVNYWVNEEGYVWASPIDAPTAVLSKADTGETTWLEVEGAESYNVYEIQDKKVSASTRGNHTIKLVDNVKSSPYIGEVGKVYAVSSIDHKGNESPPVTEIYRGVTEKESGYMEFNSNLAEEYREFLLVKPKQNHLKDFSGEGWIYWKGDHNIEDNGDRVGIFGVAGSSREGNMHFEIQTDLKRLRIRIGDVDLAVPNVIEPNEWVHVGFTYDSEYVDINGDKGLLIVYVNGAEVGRKSGETDIILKDRLMAIGDSQYRPEENVQKRPFNGRIRDFRLWEKPLSTVEMEELASSQDREFSGNEKGLFGYWQLYKPLGDVVLDLSKYKNHAEIIGSPKIKEE